MKILKSLLIVGSILFISCNRHVEVLDAQIKKQLVGNWIPKKIDWAIYNIPGENEGSLKTHKERDLYILNFFEEGGKIVSTTVNLDEDDSLSVQVDINCDDIQWSYAEKKGFKIEGIKSKNDKLNISKQNDTALKVLFNDIEYIRTNKIEHNSVVEIKKCN